MDFDKLLFLAKQNDSSAIIQLLEMYKPLFIKESIIDGAFDEDLHSELCLAFLNCVKRFKVD